MRHSIHTTMLCAMALAAYGCGGSVSSNETHQPPSPQIVEITPSVALMGSSSLTLTIYGTNLAPGPQNGGNSSAVWLADSSSTNLVTTVVDSTRLTAVVPAGLMAKAGAASVYVVVDNGALGQLKSNSLIFTVSGPPPGDVTITPRGDTVGPGSNRQFSASLDGAVWAVTWEVLEGASGGSITSTGLYTAPSNPGTFHVIAALVLDPSRSATVTISVVPAGFLPTSSMTSKRTGHTATLLADGKVLIVGGYADWDWYYTLTNTAELYDPTTDTFSATGSMAEPRAGHTATLLASGKVLITGGSDYDEPLSSAELYDPASGTFSSIGQMSTPRWYHTATLLNDGLVLIAGGCSPDYKSVSSAELFDPATGSFTPTGNMLADRARHTATLLANGEVLIAGGWNGYMWGGPIDPPWDPLSSELFHPETKSFQLSASMSTTRIGHSTSRLPDGKALLFGGVQPLQNLPAPPAAPAVAELYDPVARIIFAAGNISSSPSDHTATPLVDGRVLITGGFVPGYSGHPTYSALLFDPATGNFTAAGSLAKERAGHTATLLKDGRVLITGGVDGVGEVLASAEIYK